MRVPMTNEDRAVIHQIARRGHYANIIVLNSMFCGDNVDTAIMVECSRDPVSPALREYVRARQIDRETEM